MLGLGIEEPNLKVSESEDKSKATIIVEPLERGFALTIGNALRRTLLSALPGAAPIAIKINGALHEFTTIKGIKEDVVDIVLNIKNLFVKTKNTDLDFTTTLKINKYTPGEVHASDIEFNEQVEIKNPDLLICTLDDDATLEMEIIIGRGRGWVNADDNRKRVEDPLCITVDSIYSPVKRVSYTPETARKGQSMNYDKLTLVVETNGTMDALEATSMAAKIIQDHTMLFVSAVEGMDKLSVIESIFKNRDMAPYEDAIINACNASVDRKRRERNVKSEKRRKEEMKSKIVSAVLAALVLVGGVTITKGVVDKANEIANEITENKENYDKQKVMDEISKKIGSLVFVKDEDFNEKYDTTEVSILSQCTKRTQDNTGYMYLHQKIADKINELPAELQEYAICATLEGMGSNRSVLFDGVTTNADYLIKCLGLNDAKDLEEYLSHVNKDGSSDFSEFLNSQYEQNDFIMAVVNAELNEIGRGVSSGRN